MCASVVHDTHVLGHLRTPFLDDRNALGPDLVARAVIPATYLKAGVEGSRVQGQSGCSMSS